MRPSRRMRDRGRSTEETGSVEESVIIVREYCAVTGDYTPSSEGILC